MCKLCDDDDKYGHEPHISTSLLNGGLATDQYSNAVKLPDGSLENFTIKVAGKLFSCACHCNVFHKPDKAKLGLYKCNACGTRYSGG